ncbi:MAG: helix-turn-helix transcriptional regulator [Microbacterium sp.]|jgi:LuxR family maltose regulon positive regulatory protein|uniref:LuxR C-terminal-related transcriptional regulator n=1 Tax=Microbacterium sp. TaxID=51671 RepID=UPI002611B571|nr:LuxR C-terminal-related transcriptional regulator [Microbacterium sp.]MDF2559392.1 helix-turn-helix transcriptional regulator [Microbacterium sp.]
MSTAAVRTIIGVPRVSNEVTSRPRLTVALENDSPLTVIHGASGAGKTVAMAEWARTTTSSVVWISVDADAATSIGLARALLRALARTGVAGYSDTAERPWNTVAEFLRNRHEPIVIVLDDAAGSSRESVFDICRVVAEAPTARLIIATNRRSAFDSEGLDLVIDRITVAADELLFDVDEVSRALGVDATTAGAVLTATGGFPAVIHAAGKRSPQGGTGAILDAATRALEDYLQSRVDRSDADPADRTALIRLSITDAVDPDLARTLTGRDDMIPLLDDAEEFGFGHWSRSDPPLFTFTPVATVLLRRQLQRSHAQEIPGLTRAAVDGALRRGAPIEALRLAVDQDDLALASHIIMKGWNHLLENDGKALVGLLGRLPIARLKDQPLIAMILAICFNASKLRRIRGLQLMRVAISAANSRRKPPPPMERIFIWAAESAALRLIGMPERGGQVASRALALFQETDEAEWEAYAAEVPLLCTHLGISLYYSGQREKAVEWFDYAASLAAVHEMRHAFHSIALLSGIHALNGDMPEALHYVELIRQSAWPQNQIDGYRGTFYRVAEALLAIEAQEPERAREHVRAFGPHRATSEHWATMALTEAWVALHAQTPAAGLEQLESFRRLRGREASSSHARQVLSRPRALLQLAVGDTAAARSTVQQDAHPDRFGTVLERARLALVEGRATDASRLLAQTRLEPETPRERAEAAAVQAAALHRTAGVATARRAAESLAVQSADRGLSTPSALLPPEDFTFLRGVLAEDANGPLPAASMLPSTSDRPRLSARERVVLRELMTGASLRTIAADLNVSPNTLKTQVRSIYRKLDVANRADAVEKAAAYDLLSEP